MAKEGEERLVSHFYSFHAFIAVGQGTHGLIHAQTNRLAGRFVFGPMDMEEFVAKKDETVEKDLPKLKLTV